MLRIHELATVCPNADARACYVVEASIMHLIESTSVC